MPQRVNGSIKKHSPHKADEAMVFTILQAPNRHFSHVYRHRKPDGKRSATAHVVHGITQLSNAMNGF